MADKHRLWYDQTTRQIIGYDLDYNENKLIQFPGAQVADVDDTAFAAMRDCPPFDYLYDPEIRLAVPKPQFVLIPDKLECSVGGEIITVKIELHSPDGEVMPWERVQIKDIAEKAQVSSVEVPYSEGVFRVRGFVPGTTAISVKEVWDGTTRIRCTGGQFFKYAQASLLKLKFVNGGF